MYGKKQRQGCYQKQQTEADSQREKREEKSKAGKSCFNMKKSPAKAGLFSLDNTLINHSIRYLDKPSDIGAIDVIDEITILAVPDTLLMNRLHDSLQL
jgi:hypothetical protein